MADVTLYFAPFPGSNAIGLQIEESPDGLGSWVQLVDTSSIGTSPNWISSYLVTATSIDYWFRIRWQLEQPDPGGPDLFTEWSEPVLGSALPYHWTVPDLYRSMSQHKLTQWTNPQLQMVIDRAYWLIQNECGPYDETAEGFGDIAQMVIHVVMDRLLPTMSRAGASLGGGFEEEQMGSYRYRRMADSLELVTIGYSIPPDLRALICPFGAGVDESMLITTTHVFTETDYTLVGSEGREKVFTAADRSLLAPGTNPWPWWRSWW